MLIAQSPERTHLCLVAIFRQRIKSRLSPFQGDIPMLANLLTNSQDIAQQIHVETGLMKSLVDGLQAILAWRTHGNDFTRKLSTLAFASKSLRRHLERLMNLEETDGYMDVVLETKPNLSKDVDQLRQEHDRFRQATFRIVRRFEQMSAIDQD